MQVKTAGPRLDQLAVDTIRMLAVDAVEKAGCGHPGMPMGAADMAYVLWTRHLRYDPDDPQWPDRDRFVLSAGHGCMLLYALLHLSGYELSLDEIRNFRQWGSRTPGHPEYGHTPGVETTTGPLGQGFGNAVGMALAAKMLAARFNGKGRFDPVTHRIWAIVSDGDVMEGIASEAASLAGHLRLGNIVFLYDDNRITIEGKTDLALSEDVGARFEAYGWHVLRIDGHDRAAADRAMGEAAAETERPSLIVARTHIGHGAPTKQDSAEAHGAALGAEEVAATKRALGWPAEPAFHIPDEVRELFAERAQIMRAERGAWNEGMAGLYERTPDLANLWDLHMSRSVPPDLSRVLLRDAPLEKAATRKHSGAIIQKLAGLTPALVGGSADLAPSNNTIIKGARSIAPGSFNGRNLHFGVREHAMGAVLNGMAAHGGFIPYGGTFLIFSDYMRPAIRLAALSGLPVIYVFTHDSIFLGEDGPTHQPVEHLTSLRAIPNLVVIRPCDGTETALAWAHAVRRTDGPTALILTRQSVDIVKRSSPFAPDELVSRGGYVVQEATGGRPRLVIVATGSEVPLAAAARVLLEEDGTPTRVVSMPSLELFEAQDAAYRDSVLPDDGTPTAVIEAGVPDCWYRLVGKQALVIGLRRFGASAPHTVLAEKLGFTAPQIAERISAWLSSR